MFNRHQLKDGRQLIIRDALPPDAKALIVHANAVISETNFTTRAPGEFEITVEQERQNLKTYFDTDNKLFILAELDGQVVGLLNFAGGLRTRLRHQGEFGISVRQHSCGLGIGTLLLEALIDWAKSGGIITKINLRVRTDNPAAIKIYLRAGFVIEGTIANEMLIDGIYYHFHWMGLKL